MFRIFFVIFSAFSTLEAVSHFVAKNDIECGSIVTSSGAYQLPLDSQCVMGILVPFDKTLKLVIKTNKDGVACQSVEQSLKVIDNNGTVHSFCDKNEEVVDFVGGEASYTVQLDGLSVNLVLEIQFLATQYDCGSKIDLDVLRMSLTLTNNQKTEDCAIVLPPGVVVMVSSDMEKDEKNCTRKYELGQGPHISQMIKSTGTKCIDETPLNYLIFCPAALFWNLAPGTSVGVTLRAPDSKEEEMIEKKSLHCFPRNKIL